MNEEVLRKWLAEPRTALTRAVADGVRRHVARLDSRGTEFYGYALLPGEPYDVSRLVVATNGEADIKVSPSDAMYSYYRLSVDEWLHYDHDEFEVANRLLAEANEKFASLHTKDPDDFAMDEFELIHSKTLLEAVAQGLELAKSEGVFGVKAPFLAVWISDSGHSIMADSVRRLNPPDVTEQFLAEFG